MRYFQNRNSNLKIVHFESDAFATCSSRLHSGLHINGRMLLVLTLYRVLDLLVWYTDVFSSSQ